MAKNKISEWSSTPANNTDVGGIDIAEGCAPSGINNAMREMMAQIKDMQAGTDGDNFTVGGNLTVTGTTTLSTDLAITDGGTGASTAADARTNLGLGTIATQNSNAVAITGGTISATFTGNLTGNVTGNVSGSSSSTTGNAATVTNGVYTTNFTGSNQSLSSNGYQKFIGGLIIQWGSVTASPSGVSVTFPTAFSTACYSVSLTNGSGAYTQPVSATNLSTTGFTAYKTTGADNCYWIAIGV